jgi:hypothetical protein
MYIVNKGLEIAGEYHTPGAIIENIPAEAVAWLVQCGAIEEVDAIEAKPAKKKGGK